MYGFFYEEAYLYGIDWDGPIPRNQDAQDAVTVDVPVSDSVDAIVNNAIFNQLKEKFNWDRPSSSFGADIYTELVAFITENIME